MVTVSDLKLGPTVSRLNIFNENLNMAAINGFFFSVQNSKWLGKVQI